MSNAVRIAIVAEGKTDFVVICAAIEAILQGVDFEPVLLQPDYPVGDQAGPTGEGWGGVYRWCEQARSQGNGHVSGAPILAEAVVIQLDADVAAKDYSHAHLHDSAGDLPCEQACPPAQATTDRLRQVLLRWTGDSHLAEGFVFCTPSKSMETWVLAALFPNDKVMLTAGWECHPDPDGRLAVQPKSLRISKSVAAYRGRSENIKDRWTAVRKMLSEAERFSQEFEDTPAAKRALASKAKKAGN